MASKSITYQVHGIKVSIETEPQMYKADEDVAFDCAKEAARRFANETGWGMRSLELVIDEEHGIQWVDKDGKVTELNEGE